MKPRTHTSTEQNPATRGYGGQPLGRFRRPALSRPHTERPFRTRKVF